MPAKLGGHTGPQPLRSAEHLRGFPHLTGADKTKVDLANQLYQSAIRILQVCMILGCLVSIENPSTVMALGTSCCFSQRHRRPAIHNMVCKFGKRLL